MSGYRSRRNGIGPNAFPGDIDKALLKDLRKGKYMNNGWDKNADADPRDEVVLRHGPVIPLVTGEFATWGVESALYADVDEKVKGDLIREYNEKLQSASASSAVDLNQQYDDLLDEQIKRKSGLQTNLKLNLAEEKGPDKNITAMQNGEIIIDLKGRRIVATKVCIPIENIVNLIPQITAPSKKSTLLDPLNKGLATISKNKIVRIGRIEDESKPSKIRRFSPKPPKTRPLNPQPLKIRDLNPTSPKNRASSSKVPKIRVLSPKPPKIRPSSPQPPKIRVLSPISSKSTTPKPQKPRRLSPKPSKIRPLNPEPSKIRPLNPVAPKIRRLSPKPSKMGRISPVLYNDTPPIPIAKTNFGNFKIPKKKSAVNGTSNDCEKPRELKPSRVDEKPRDLEPPKVDEIPRDLELPKVDEYLGDLEPPNGAVFRYQETSPQPDSDDENDDVLDLCADIEDDFGLGSFSVPETSKCRIKKF